MRILRFFIWTSLLLVVSGGALFGYFVYTPEPKVPRLSGAFARGEIDSGGLKRTYLIYAPKGLAQGAPLVVAMHGSGGDSEDMRTASASPTNTASPSSILRGSRAIGTRATPSATTRPTRATSTTSLS
jgi:hypothetical protein